MEPKLIEPIQNTLSDAKKIIQDIEKILDVKILSFICHAPITHIVAYKLNKVIRKCDNTKNLAILIDSGGGDIDATSKIVKLIKSYCNKYIAIIPFYAKSAATLLAVSADKMIICKAGELGPVDPQVRDPITGLFVPASSIKDAIDFIQETKDPFVKLSLADKIPPLLMGAYRAAQNVSRQYISEAFDWLGSTKEDAIHTFLDKYFSHGYPIDRDTCKQLALSVEFPDNNLEERIHDLHETYIDLLSEISKHLKKTENRGNNLIIQTTDQKCVIINDDDITKLLDIPPEKKRRKKETQSKKQSASTDR